MNNAFYRIGAMALVYVFAGGVAQIMDATPYWSAWTGCLFGFIGCGVINSIWPISTQPRIMPEDLP